MRDKQIQNLLRELYSLDESLRLREKELLAIISDFAHHKPKINLSDKYLQELKSELMTRARSMSLAKKEDKLKNQPKLSFNFMKKFIYIGSGVVLGALLIVPIIKQTGLMDLNVENRLIQIGSAPQIEDIESNAFGSLLAINDIRNADSYVNEGAALGLGGGGATTETKAMIGIPSPDLYNYEYVYVGDDVSLDNEKVQVYKRINDSGNGKALAKNFINSIDYKLFDLKKFASPEISHLSFVEDREFGYMIYFNLQDNNLSISSNWEKWPRVGEECQDQECFDFYRLTIDDVPSDEVLIGIADKFLQEYNIKKDDYGNPVVQDNWKKTYERYNDKENAYIPDTISVIYPFVVNDSTLKEESGTVIGLSVNVNIRYNKVAGANNIYPQKYISSEYEAVTDVSKVIGLAERGGNTYLYNNPEAGRTIELRLGTPSIELIRYWHYNGQNSKGGEELYLPAMIFPILNKEDTKNYYRDFISVPLVKEIFDARYENSDDTSMPIPLLRGSAILETETTEEGE